MAYSQVSVLSVNDIPAAIATFAAANGWSVNVSVPAQPTFNHPSKPGSMTFRIRALISGTNNQNKDVIIEDTGVIATSRAVMRSPKLAGLTNNPTVPNPTTISMFAGTFPEPYIAVAIAFGVNLYRHMYLGFMETLGNYTGGEVISCTAGSSNVSSLSVSYTAISMFKNLFGSRRSTAIVAKNESGGVRLVHANNPIPWRIFSSTTSIATPFNGFLGDEIIGGYGDGNNDVMVARGHSTYSGAAIFTPCNLLISRAIPGDVRFAPVGHPCGVRLVNVRDLTEGQIVQIGSEIWRCYPAVSKRPELVMSGASITGFYRDFESSFQQGYAYRVA